VRKATRYLTALMRSAPYIYAFFMSCRGMFWHHGTGLCWITSFAADAALSALILVDGNSY
jgi:hypothetical protein